MPKPANTAGSDTIRVTLSEQSVALLEKIAALGIYGRNPAEVAGRFVDAALAGFVEVPKFKLDEDGEGKDKRK